MWAYRLAVAGAVIGWVVVIPYFFYVMRFLDPSTIVTRLQQDAIRVIEEAAEGKYDDAEQAQEDIQERLFQIGTLVIKSIGRADRSTAREGVWSYKRIVQRYGELKASMGDDWFKVDRKDFVGMSHHAIDMINEKQTWMETHTLQQLLLAYQNALAKAPDVVSSIANTVRIITRQAADRDDAHVVSIGIRTFNSFLREALNRGDVRAAFDVLYQYRQMAGDMMELHAHVRRIGTFLVTYAAVAEDNDCAFVSRLIGFDLQNIIEKAYLAENPHAKEMLADLLNLPNSVGSGHEPMRVEVKLIMAAFFLEQGMKGELKRVRNALKDTEPALVTEAAERLTGIEKRVFWEITDRGVNIEWTPKKRRKKIQQFVDSMS